MKNSLAKVKSINLIQILNNICTWKWNVIVNIFETIGLVNK